MALRKKILRRLLLVALVLMAALLMVSSVVADGSLGLGLTAVDANGNPITQVQTGDIIEYIIDYSCADLTDGCGDLDITFTLDLTKVELIEVITSPSYINSYTAPDVLIENNPVSNPDFDGGESAQAKIRVRVLSDIDPDEDIPAQVEGSITDNFTNGTTTIITTTTPIDVLPPTEQWRIEKVQVVPTPPTGPAPGGIAVYEVRFCPDSTDGNIAITNPVLTDTFPLNAVVLDAGGGQVSGNTITWTSDFPAPPPPDNPALDNPLRPQDGCESVQYTLEFPEADFPLGTAFNNSVIGDGDNPEIDPGGICVGDCPNDTVNDQTDPPTASLGTVVSKGGPGTSIIIAPGDSDGTSEFTFGLDLSANNIGLEAGTTLVDDLTATNASDGSPALSVTQINGGTWNPAPDGTPIRAQFEIETEILGVAQPTITLGPVDGSTPATNWTSAGGDFVGPGNGGRDATTTDQVTEVRMVFLDPLPPGFTFNNAPGLRFIVRDGMAAADYDDGSGTATYQNCIDADGSFISVPGDPTAMPPIAPTITTTTGQGCSSIVTTDDPDGFANITVGKESDVEDIFPLEPITFTLTVNLTQEASGSLINPAIEDILPVGLEFVSWDSITINSTGGDVVNNPYLLVDTIGAQPGLLFFWDGASFDADALGAGLELYAFGSGVPLTGVQSANPLNLTPPDSGNKTITIQFTARATLSAAAGPYTNTFRIASESPNMDCQSGLQGDDVDDIDDDGLTTGDVRCEAGDGYSVREAAEMGSQKWIRSIDGVNGTFDFFRFNNLYTPAGATECPIYNFDTDNADADNDVTTGTEAFTRYPCVAEGLPNENFEYVLRAINTGIVDTDNYVLYDILPHIGDEGVSQLLDGQGRDTEFQAFLTGQIEIEFVTPSGFAGRTFTPATFEVQYSDQLDPCRGEVANPSGAINSWPGGCVNNWNTNPAVFGGFANVRSFRVAQTNSGTGIIPANGGELVLSVPMQINSYGNAPELAETGEIAWNSFAQHFFNALSGNSLLAAEPPKVGIVVSQRFSVGNRVWIDNGNGNPAFANDGIINNGEAGINGVVVQLLDGTGTVIATDVTRADTSSGLAGYYFFGNLDGGPTTNYQIRIPAFEFNGSDLDGPDDILGNDDDPSLAEYISSTGNIDAALNNEDDSNDTGIDPAIAAYTTDGVTSSLFTLTDDDEAALDSDVNDDDTNPDGPFAPGDITTDEGPLGRGIDFENEGDSDLTVDFGFFKPMSIGNRVWLDDGAGGTGILNDGIINGNEINQGIVGVTLRLYASDGTTEIDDPNTPGTQPYEVTTDAAGYYLFDLLPPGDYIVRIMPENFQFDTTPPITNDGPLANYISSNATPFTGAAETPLDENADEYILGVSDEQDDLTDHGIDPATDGLQRTNGIYSAVIQLREDAETNSELASNKNADGDGRRVTEINSDLTVDFGFFEESTTFSLGNVVWFDENNNGVFDAGEVGVDGVVIELFADDNGDGTPDTPGTPVVPATTTAGGGFYRFDNLDPGRYVVHIIPDNFDLGPDNEPGTADDVGVLASYISSTGASGDDERDDGLTTGGTTDNGIDQTDGSGLVANTVYDDYELNGVFSSSILLEPEGEPDATNNLPDDAESGPGDPGPVIEDDNSDLTVDFGFFRPMSIGNRVWLDNGVDASGVTVPADRNDGVIDANEVGIPGVVVNLYDATDLATIIDTDTTDASGYYLFDNLTPGTYVVEIPFENFDATAPSPLRFHESSIPETPGDTNGVLYGNPAVDDDSTDHGDFASNTQVTAAPGVRSAVITLAYGSEPTSDTDLSGDAADGPQSRGQFGETDNNSDLTVDFGFYLPPLSIGNRVWYDNNDNGVIDGTDDNPADAGATPGIGGVTVGLYASDGTTTIDDPSNPGNPYTTTTTLDDPGTVGVDESGYYLFENLPPGDYIVRVLPGNFNGGALTNYISSTDTGISGDNQQDSNTDENGIDPVDGTGPTANSVIDEYIADGVSSTIIELRPRTEPLISTAPGTEVDRSPDTTTFGPNSDGTTGEDDNGSDLTIDFGFYQPLSIGNFVWRDDGNNGAGGVNVANYNNSVFDTNEVGIGGVDVNLYRDVDGDGDIDPGDGDILLDTVQTSTTGNVGFYLFDGLPEGNYIVEIPASNFATNTDPLFELVSSEDALDALTPGTPVDGDGDNNDHGIDPAAPGNAVLSPSIPLTLTTDEPLGEGGSGNAADGPNGRGNNGEADNNSDLTVDFGFVAPPMSIGNRVWIDDGGNGTNPAQFDDGIFNGAEVGLDGVAVSLYLDADANGEPDGPAIATDVTGTVGAGGYYLFDNLPPETYLVGIDLANFDLGPDGVPGTGDDLGVLAGYSSSTSIAPSPGDDDLDNNDHGRDALDATYGILSPPIALASGTEPSPTGTQDDAEDVTGTSKTTGLTIADDNSDLTVDFGFVRPMSIGNRVWLDNDRTGTPGDGIRQAGELGIGNVLVQLFTDAGGGTPGTLIAETTTNAQGYYIFDETTTVTAPSTDDPNDSPIGPGDYVVVIAASNFALGADGVAGTLDAGEGRLAGLKNSDGANGSGTDNQTDSTVGAGDENGVNTTTQLADGVRSTTIQLRYDTEPLAATETDRDPAIAPTAPNYNGLGVEDDNADFTIDFGFYNAVAIGNRVWFDNNRNGLIDGTDDNPDDPGTTAGIPGVTVHLYRDVDGDGLLTGAELTTIIATDVTDADGYYLFDQTGDQSVANGGSLLLPGTYVVGIDRAAGTNATILATMTNTETRVGGTGLDAGVDNDDNGIDQRDLGTTTAPPIIYSEPIAISHDTETTAELAGDKGTDGDGRYGIQDDSSDLTVDFGFYRPLSIGNRVWLDSDNDGTINGAETGIDGVLVELYIDADADNDPDTPGTPYRSTVTVTDSTSGQAGYYLFDDLPEGNYVVEIAERNFQNLTDDGNAANGVEGILYSALAGGPLFSSEPTTQPPGYNLDDGSDNNDNGVDEPAPQTTGVRSLTINLSYNAEPPGNPATLPDDTDLNNDVGEGRFGELDFNADMTIDFGFYIPSMSIGNRVWIDLNNNGVIDANDDNPATPAVGDPGVDGVVVNLLDNTGVFIATTTTANGGYYIFDLTNVTGGVQPGTYIVEIDEDNFRAGNVLEHYISSTGDTDDSTSIDSDGTVFSDNGLDDWDSDGNLETGGVRSVVITLTSGGEIINEGDKDLSGNSGPTGDGQPNIEFTNSELTIDFGFYQPMSIGNRVWFDTNDNSIIDGTELGIAGVLVELYGDFDGDGAEDAVPRTDTTDATGHYLFDNLNPGTYRVEIPASNFDTVTPGPLAGLSSSTDANDATTPGTPADDDPDRNDHGIDDADPATNGIASPPIVLGPYDTELLNETDISLDPTDGPNRIGNTGEIDSNSDITVDFGFNAPTMSLGNRVWFDINNDGVIDADGLDNVPGNADDEVGLGSVAVSLYTDTNADGVPDGPAIATTTTDANGYYLFDNLAPGTYLVGVDGVNFSGGVLTGAVSSTVEGGDTQTDTDVDENGQNPVDGDVTLNNTVTDEYTSNGVLSGPILLTTDGEPTAETDTGVLGDGSADPDDSDLTVDFGFYRPMSIGNRVWFDTNNNSLIDLGETGIPGVLVELYGDFDGDGTEDIAPRTDNTDATGHYLFGGLAPGTYRVVIPASNFTGPLTGLTSSDDTLDTTTPGTPGDADPDTNDHGVDDPAFATNGISSPTIVLALATEVAGETDLSSDPVDGPQRRGNNGEADNSSDLTVDFGFTGAQMSLGNRVWLDDGAGTPANRNNGQVDAGEIGIGNVAVALFADGDNDGVPDGGAITTTLTDADGYYLFDNLAPGRYIVGIDAANFNGTAPLVGLASSTGNGGDNGVDSPAPGGDENGIDSAAAAFNGVLSETITLALTTETQTETDLGTLGSGTATNDNSDLTIDFGFYPAMSVGNRVWFDPNDNGLIDAGEVGIAGVTVTLLVDNGGGFVPTGLMELTDTNGYYLFDGLEPGTYQVQVDASNFAAMGVLEGFNSSTGTTGDDDVDSNDNGSDTTPGDVLSDPIVLTLNGEITGETDPSGNTVNDGPNSRGTNGETDNNSNLTVDFGFNAAEPLSLGNRVWRDDGGTSGTPNNGTQEGGEVGIDGVTVELFRDTNSDGIPDGGVVATDVTAGGGYYLFDNLPPGDYIVRVAPSNFNPGGPLYGLFSTTGTSGDDGIDSDGTVFSDNGIDSINPATNGILSSTIELLPDGNEPTGEGDLGPEGTGVADDDSSDITVDFGFLPRFDRGDAPDSYGTTIGANGPAHQIVSNLYLGNQVDDDNDGAPAVVNDPADGDDADDGNDDEDGITLPTLIAGTTIPVDMTVFNNTGTPATAILWIDYNGNGTFDAGEAVTVTVPSAPTPQIIPVTITVPQTADVSTGGTTYARLRLTTDPITSSDPTGTASDGEVEDYEVTIDPPDVAITKSDGRNSIVVGQSTTYTITISNGSAVDVVNRQFTDVLPAAFDAATATWTCDATLGAAGATCNAANDTTASGTGGVINTIIDVPSGGLVVFTYTATLPLDYDITSGTTITNQAVLELEPPAEDVNGVIFDPPNGVKTGVVLGQDRIRWTMVWFNTGAAQNATVSDTLPPEQTFAGNLVCTPFGASTTASCGHSGGVVSWSGIIDNGNANRVEIAFDVTVPGDGTYNNIGTISVGSDQATASDDVRIGDPPLPPPGAGGDPGPFLVDPAIVKLVDPAFAQPGEAVDWTIVVTNPHSTPVFDVSFVDIVPDEMETLGVDASAGTVNVSGQTVTFNINVLDVGESVTVVIRTQIRPDVEVPYVITNRVGDASASVLSAQELPPTGETPAWRDPLILLLLVSGPGLLLISGAWVWMRRQQSM